MSILVTGAGGGIGRGIVERAVREGHAVVAQDLNADGLALLDDEVVTTAGDVTDPAYRDELAALAEEHAIDAAILAHGISGAIAFDALDESACRRVMSVNTGATIELATLLAPGLSARGGAVVTVASLSALRPERENSIYCSSKWALLAWAQAADAESEHAIRTLCPGRTDSPMLHEANGRIARAMGISVEEYFASTLELVPLGRLATVEEIAAGALLLAAPAGASVPNVLTVAGGEVHS